MGAVNFAKEFTELIARYTKSSTLNEGNAGHLTTPLTTRQIVSAIHDVVQIMLGVSLHTPDYSSVKTPATGISICTPNAPIVTKNNLDMSSSSIGRYRSLDTLTNLQQSSGGHIRDGEPLSKKSREDMDVDNEKLEVSLEEKKFISRSSPAIHLNDVGRSDTFVCEESEKNSENDSPSEESNATSKKEPTASEQEKLKSHSVLQKMEELRQCAFDMISKIDVMKKEMYPHATKPIRRLSSIGGYANMNRASTLTRPIQPTKLRRSSIGFLGTPTSSKLNTTVTAEPDSNSGRRKTIAASTQIKSPKISPTGRTPTALVVPLNKKSPLSSGGRPAKNPKYAHVQSTIPKAYGGKRKAP